MRGETKAEQVSRVVQMSIDDDGDTWDLNDSDRLALEAVVTDRAALLDALKGVVDHLGGSLKRARAAIAKAEGRP